jgi:predicted secreted protein
VETNYREGLDINDYREIALLLKSLETTCDMNEVNEIFKDIWEYQLFDDGNTRVLLAYKRLHLLRIGRLMAISSVLKIQSSYRIFDEATCRQR